jgi:serine/threonine-protein kinase HipA
VVSLERRDLALSIGDQGRTASVYNLIAQDARFSLSAADARAEIESLVGWPCVCTQWQPCEMPAQGMMKHEAWGSISL